MLSLAESTFKNCNPISLLLEKVDISTREWQSFSFGNSRGTAVLPSIYWTQAYDNKDAIRCNTAYPSRLKEHGGLGGSCEYYFTPRATSVSKQMCIQLKLSKSTVESKREKMEQSPNATHSSVSMWKFTTEQTIVGGVRQNTAGKYDCLLPVYAEWERNRVFFFLLFICVMMMDHHQQSSLYSSSFIHSLGCNLPFFVSLLKAIR